MVTSLVQSFDKPKVEAKLNKPPLASTPGGAFTTASLRRTFSFLASTISQRSSGDDFKSGQTKMKSALIEFFAGADIKPERIASYNHLNDGRESIPSTKLKRTKEYTDGARL